MFKEGSKVGHINSFPEGMAMMSPPAFLHKRRGTHDLIPKADPNPLAAFQIF